MIEGEPTKTYNYSYGDAWKDQLTNFDGQSIVYDTCGNPTSYLGATLAWSKGRLLTRFTKDSTTSRMTYDANGIRMSKLRVNHIDIVDSSYIYDSNGRLRTETEGAYTRRYIYSSDGIVGYEENGERYFYRKYLFGDITAIYQGATKLAEYVYDAWGNCTVTYDTNGIGARNPMRYRGYYWDKDLKMYYLMTRYYDPKTGRFINADTINYLDPETIGGLNLYSYCKNNPVMLVDYSGTDAVLVTIFGKGGLPIVGHSALFIQDSEGNWYFTQFTGYIDWSASTWKNPFPVVSYIETIPLEKDQSFEDFLSEKEYTNYKLFEFSGDYSNSVNKAIDYVKDYTKYNGKYSLLFNNCGDYVEELLLGMLNNDPILTTIRSCLPSVPNILYAATIITNSVVELVGTISSWFDSIW